MQRKFSTQDLYNIRRDAQFKVMMDLVAIDYSLSKHAAFKMMIDKIKNRRCYIECVICENVSKEVWNKVYEGGLFVGYHCEDHKEEFHKTQQSGRHCCDARTSSGDSDIQYEISNGSIGDDATQM